MMSIGGCRQSPEVCKQPSDRLLLGIISKTTDMIKVRIAFGNCDSAGKYIYNIVGDMLE